MWFLCGLVITVSARVLDLAVQGWMDPAETMDLSPAVLWSGYPKDFASDHHMQSPSVLSPLQIKEDISFCVTKMGYWWSRKEYISSVFYCHGKCLLEADQTIQRGNGLNKQSLQYRWGKLLQINHMRLAWNTTAITNIPHIMTDNASGMYRLAYKQLNWRVVGEIYNTTSLFLIDQVDLVFPLITSDGFLDGIIGVDPVTLFPAYVNGRPNI